MRIMATSLAVSLITTTMIFIIMAMQTISQLQPMNITRTAGETFVFIPCPYETSSSRSIWRINGTDYTVSTLPSIYSLTPGGLFIIRVHICLNKVPFQCIDISRNSLQEEVSQVGVLTVISPTGENCTDDALREYLSSGIDATGFELDHRRMRYSSNNITFAWKTTPPSSECRISRILSYPECQPNSPDTNVTTNDTMLTVSSTSLYISEQLADFNLSSLSDLESAQCAGLLDTVRINVNRTEMVSVLLGVNNCSCARLESLQSLYFAVSNPDVNELDVTCPIFTSDNSCYSPEICNGFKTEAITAFFRICENSYDNTFSLCSSNVTEQLDGLRLDFYTLTRPICASLYYSRTYIQSFEFKVTKASVNIETNFTSGEICFSSSTDCSLASLTQYSVVITDLSGNTILQRDEILESTCLTIVDQLRLLPQCGPFMILTRPFNDFIVYNSDLRQEISSGADSSEEPTLLTCLEASVQLQLDAVYDLQDSLIELNVQCSTVYTTPIYITLMDRNGFMNQTTYTCSNGRFEIVPSGGCNRDIQLCGYFTFENGSVVMERPLNCSNSVAVPCPTSPPLTTQPGPSPSPGVIVGIVVGVLPALILIVIIVIVVCVFIIRRGHHHGDISLETFKQNGDEGKGIPPDSAAIRTTSDGDDDSGKNDLGTNV